MKKRTGSAVPRSERLNSEFRKEIYEIITRRLHDPEITGLVSVTKVETSRDLSHAKVFFSVFEKDENKKSASVAAVKKNAGKIRFELGSAMRIRTVPELTFIEDDSMEYGDKMDKLFLKIEKGEKI